MLTSVCSLGMFTFHPAAHSSLPPALHCPYSSAGHCCRTLSSAALTLSPSSSPSSFQRSTNSMFGQLTELDAQPIEFDAQPDAQLVAQPRPANVPVLPLPHYAPPLPPYTLPLPLPLFPPLSPSLSPSPPHTPVPLDDTTTVAPSRKQYACTQCDAVFPRSYNLKRHVNSLHSVVNKQQCQLCGELLTSKSFKLHAASCTGPDPTNRPLSSAAVAALPTRPLSPILQLSPDVTDSPVILTNSGIDCAAADFYVWLQEPPMPLDGMLRKATTLSALEQEKEHLHHIVRQIDAELPLLFRNGVQLQLLVVPDTVNKLVSAMQRRGVASGTVYPVALLLKKVCVWMCSRQSRVTGQWVSPQTTLPQSWALLCQLCTDTTKQRKRDTHAKRLRGADEHKWMQEAEVKLLLKACLERMATVQREVGDVSGLPAREGNPPLPPSPPLDASDYTDHLIVAVLLLGLAPRPQTLRGLTTESLRKPGQDSRSPEQYVLDGEHNKTDMPFYVALPAILTPAITFYLEKVLRPGYTGPLFLQAGGTARQDFSIVTSKVTKRYLGRRITASKFRMSVATAVLGRPGVNGKSLAALMGHSEAVQQQYYVGAHMARDARICQEQLLEGVSVSVGVGVAAAAGAAATQ